jgi:hypothetical protein
VLDIECSRVLELVAWVLIASSWGADTSMKRSMPPSRAMVGTIIMEDCLLVNPQRYILQSELVTLSHNRQMAYVGIPATVSSFLNTVLHSCPRESVLHGMCVYMPMPIFLQRDIYNNCKLLVELCVVKLDQDWFVLLDLLAVVLSPSAE